MPLSIQPVRPEHHKELARICFEAFGSLQDRHAVERDFPSLEMAEMLIGLFASSPTTSGFVAIDGNRILGSNFIAYPDAGPSSPDGKSGVAGVGPITVRPDAQSAGAGRLLMLAVMEEASRLGINQVRLLQEAINTCSLSLYTKLGFDWREAIALMRLAPAAADDPRASPITESDLDAVDAISRRHYHSSRVNEVHNYLRIKLPGFLLRRDSRAVGYYFPTFTGHGFAETADDMAALIGHTARHAPPHFLKSLLPLGQNDLHRQLLAAGCRTVKLFNYMTTGEYRPPQHAWLPSIGM